jgi:uncharacterized membrane protein YkoI
LNLSFKYLIFICYLVISVSWAGGDIGRAEAKRLRENGEIRPLQEILQLAKTYHDGRVIEVELEKKHNLYVYEIEIVDKNGRVWEMKFDAKNAALISQKLDD